MHWLPEHIKEGRFGDFLANNVDWALSRERYWGTPLNIWINDETGKMEAPRVDGRDPREEPEGVRSLRTRRRRRTRRCSEHLVVHKPWIDQVTWQNPGEDGTYRRVPEVIDCWFDSGCMPFAQWGFPHAPGSVEQFQTSFPADFISEAIDQTRGWFYSLLMISTLALRRGDAEALRPRAACARVSRTRTRPASCSATSRDKEGKKESKSKGNYTPPEVILDRVHMEFAVLDAKDAKA